MDKFVKEKIKELYLKGRNAEEIYDRTTVPLVKIREVISEHFKTQKQWTKEDRILQARSMEINAYKMALEEANTGVKNPDLDSAIQTLATYCA
jgi:hypothetical protein